MRTIQRKPMKRSRRKALFGLVFTAPFLIGFLFVFLQILINSIRFSFSDIEMGTGSLIYHFVGWEHYRYAFTVDPDFGANLATAVRQTLVDIPVLLIFALFIATLLNQKMRGRVFFRAVFFLPVILLTGVIAQADYNIAMGSGSLNTVLETGAAAGGAIENLSILETLRDIGLAPGVVDYVEGLIDSIFSIVSRSGVQILVFLASLQSISPSIYEAAQMEGATGWEIYWKITIPMLSPYILACGIYTLIDSFTNPDNLVMTIINTAGNNVSRFGLASAMTWSYIVIIVALLGLLCLLLGRFAFYQEKEG